MNLVTMGYHWGLRHVVFFMMDKRYKQWGCLNKIVVLLWHLNYSSIMTITRSHTLAVVLYFASLCSSRTMATTLLSPVSVEQKLLIDPFKVKTELRTLNPQQVSIYVEGLLGGPKKLTLSLATTVGELQEIIKRKGRFLSDVRLYLDLGRRAGSKQGVGERIELTEAGQTLAKVGVRKDDWISLVKKVVKIEQVYIKYLLGGIKGISVNSSMTVEGLKRKVKKLDSEGRIEIRLYLENEEEKSHTELTDLQLTLVEVGVKEGDMLRFDRDKGKKQQKKWSWRAFASFAGNFRG